MSHRCICDVQGYTIVVTPKGHPYDCEHSEWLGWTQMMGVHQERIKAISRKTGYSKRGMPCTFREWAQKQGGNWFRRASRPKGRVV